MAERYSVDLTGSWALYCPGVPAGCTVLGTVTREGAGETGALLQTGAGVYVQACERGYRTLSQRAVREALAASAAVGALDSGQRLKAWREGHELSQSAAARLFGVHPITYAKWETGLQGMVGPALRLAQVLERAEGFAVVRALAGHA